MAANSKLIVRKSMYCLQLFWVCRQHNQEPANYTNISILSCLVHHTRVVCYLVYHGKRDHISAIIFEAVLKFVEVNSEVSLAMAVFYRNGRMV